MTHRYELVTLQRGYRAIRFRDGCERILLRSIDPIADVPTAAGTIDWLRGALGKDWLYRVGRPQPHSGPAFTLHPRSGIVLASPTFSSSDAMERAIDLLKSACATAPVVILPERVSGGGALAPEQSGLDGVQHGKQVRHRGDDVVRAARV